MKKFLNIRRAPAKWLTALAALAAVAATSSSPTSAATHSHTQTLTVRGSVTQNCSLTTHAVAFPNIGVGYLHPSGNKPVTVQSSLGMKCTKGAVVQISVNAGLYGSKAGTQFGSRSMKSSPGKSYLGYDLCHDSGCLTVWSPVNFTYTSPSDAGSSLPLWGRIVTGQTIDAGSYSDSVTVTVSF